MLRRGVVELSEHSLRRTWLSFLSPDALVVAVDVLFRASAISQVPKRRIPVRPSDGRTWTEFALFSDPFRSCRIQIGGRGGVVPHASPLFNGENPKSGRSWNVVIAAFEGVEVIKSRAVRVTPIETYELSNTCTVQPGLMKDSLSWKSVPEIQLLLSKQDWNIGHDRVDWLQRFRPLLVECLGQKCILGLGLGGEIRLTVGPLLSTHGTSMVRGVAKRSAIFNFNSYLRGTVSKRTIALTYISVKLWLWRHIDVQSMLTECLKKSRPQWQWRSRWIKKLATSKFDFAEQFFSYTGLVRIGVTRIYIVVR